MILAGSRSLVPSLLRLGHSTSIESLSLTLAYQPHESSHDICSYSRQVLASIRYRVRLEGSANISGPEFWVVRAQALNQKGLSLRIYHEVHLRIR